jgi:hypothetical protein
MTKYDPQKHHRRSIRLRRYDYRSPGAYFVTICTQGRECVLYDPVVFGIIQDVWNALPGWFPGVTLDEFVIMPNHVHFILWIQPVDVGQGRGGTPTGRPQGAEAIGAGVNPAPTGRPHGAGIIGAGAMGAGASPAPTGRPGMGAIGTGASPAPTGRPGAGTMGAGRRGDPCGRPQGVEAIGAGASPAPTGRPGVGAIGTGASPAPTGRPGAGTMGAGRRGAETPTCQSEPDAG